MSALRAGSKRLGADNKLGRVIAEALQLALNTSRQDSRDGSRLASRRAPVLREPRPTRPGYFRGEVVAFERRHQEGAETTLGCDQPTFANPETPRLTEQERVPTRTPNAQ